jgi:hypothetical protein
VRRAEAGEGRHQHDLLRRVGLRRERAGLRRMGDDAEPVAQPLHRRARDEDRALERIGPLPAELVGDGGQQARARGDRRAPVLSRAKQPVP